MTHIYHDGLANENSRIALSNDAVFNNCRYSTPHHYIPTLHTYHNVLHFFILYISEKCKKAMLVHPTVTCRQIELMTMSHTCQRGVFRKLYLAFTDSKPARSGAKGRLNLGPKVPSLFLILISLAQCSRSLFCLGLVCLCVHVYHFICKRCGCRFF